MSDYASLTEQIDARLIADGYPAECVTWVCEEHNRHCTHIGSNHTHHECSWGDPAPPKSVSE